ncbi:MAG: hypothetical protein H6Q42_3901 [Deltaproteobacteria bacterium]|nr:hypothetical protein [Deltaproteobacteria bacterium]
MAEEQNLQKETFSICSKRGEKPQSLLDARAHEALDKLALEE